MKKFFLTSVLISLSLFSTILLAANENNPFESWNGLYMGFGLGSNASAFRHVAVSGQGEYESVLAQQSTSPIAANFDPQNSSQLMSQVALGYGRQFERFYLGGKVFLELVPSMSKKVNGQSNNGSGPGELYDFNVRATMQTGMASYGAQIEQGLLVAPQVLVYVQEGLLLQPWSMSLDSNLAVTNTVAPIIKRWNTSHATKNFLQTEFLYGLGIRWHLNRTWALDFDYQVIDGHGRTQTISDYYSNLQNIGRVHLSDDVMATSATAKLQAQQSAILSLQVAF